jgi:hypothetical protein
LTIRGRAVLLGLILSCAAAPIAASAQERPEQASESLLFAWLKDNDGEHAPFLAVIDADPQSRTYAQVLTTASAGVALDDAHHIPHSMPSGGRIFANAFRDGRTFIFDTRAPRLPRRVGGFERIDGYSFPHSFVELPGGNFLVTFQTSGEDADQAGGILELDADGALVRAGSAADPSHTDFIRPYSLEYFPGIDRVVSSSADMWKVQATEEVQLWRFSDLTLLDTVSLPKGEPRNIQQIPLEVRPVGDGSSAYVVTWNCGLYHLSGIEGRTIQAELVWDFSSNGCAIPLRLGNYWIQTVGKAWQIVVLDIRDPARPQLATVLQFPEDFEPHWIAAEPGGERIVMTGYASLSDRIVLLRFDPGAQNLEVIEGFGEESGTLPGVLTNRAIWPHGKTGDATAHGVVFWPGEAEP